MKALGAGAICTAVLILTAVSIYAPHALPFDELLHLVLLEPLTLGATYFGAYWVARSSPTCGAQLLSALVILHCAALLYGGGDLKSVPVL
jgi:hypothetical protein